MTTSLEELRAKKYIEVTLPGWDGDDVFEVKLKRVNLLDLAAQGTIPNPLIGVVTGLFKGKAIDPEDENSLKQINDLAEIFAKATMAEPTFEEVQEAIGLTDEQKIIIYTYAVKGVRVLDSFRKKSTDVKPDRDEQEVSEKA